MNLKQAILSTLGREALRHIVNDLELGDVDRRSVEAMRAALRRSRRVSPEDLLWYLRKDEVQGVCRTLGLPSTGRRDDLVQRLLNHDQAGQHRLAGKPRGARREEAVSRRALSDGDGAVDPQPGRLGRQPSSNGQDQPLGESKKVAKKKSAKEKATNGNGANLGFEATLWQTADKLRNNLDAAEYKHVVLGLIFLKYISDAFEDQHAKLQAEVDEGADPEDPDEYKAANAFWVPPEARWAHLQSKAKQPTIGKLVDQAMVAIERDNPRLKGVLPKDFARPALDKHRLGELIDLIGRIALGDSASRSKDILGRVYEYFLAQFASAEGKKGGQFYTPRCVVQVLVEMLAPYKGRVYDPCCGSGGMFVQSEKFVEAHGGRIGDIAIYGQESNPTTRRLALMNLAIRGIDGDLGPEHADSFRRDLHKDLKADYVLANPPFNDSDWVRKEEDVRWKYGIPPKGNANYAWVQHFIHHLAPSGLAGFVLANGSMSSNQSGEGEIRRAIVEDDLVDCMVALPGQLFYSTQIPVCLWFLARSKKNGRFNNRRRQTLFIDARKLGMLVDRVHRELTDEEIQRIAGTYHAWRGDKGADEYQDVPGFCKSATIEEIAEHGYVLTPGRYVGAAEIEEDDEPFEEKMDRCVTTLNMQFAESAKLEAEIRSNLEGLGYGV